MNILIAKMPFIPHEDFACVYRLNLGAGVYYIGSTTNLEKRINTHLSNIRTGRRDISEHLSIISGRYILKVIILEEIINLSEMQVREQFYLDAHCDDPKCLNICKKASINVKVKRLLEKN